MDDSRQQNQTQSNGKNKPAVYYSSNPNWKPSDKNAVVIYTNKSGVTTGKSNISDSFIPSGIKTTDTTKDKSGGLSNVGSEIAKSIVYTNETSKDSLGQGVTSFTYTQPKQSLNQVLQPPTTALTPYITGEKQPSKTISQQLSTQYSNVSLPKDTSYKKSGTVTNMQPSSQELLFVPRNEIASINPERKLKIGESFKESLFYAKQDIFGGSNTPYVNPLKPLGRMDLGFDVSLSGTALGLTPSFVSSPVQAITGRKAVYLNTESNRPSDLINPSVIIPTAVEIGVIALTTKGAGYFAGSSLGATPEFITGETISTARKGMTVLGVKDIIGGALNKEMTKVPFTDKYVPSGAVQQGLGIIEFGTGIGSFKEFERGLVGLRETEIRALNFNKLANTGFGSIEVKELESGMSLLTGSRKATSKAFGNIGTITESIRIEGKTIDTGVQFFTPSSKAVRIVDELILTKGNIDPLTRTAISNVDTGIIGSKGFSLGEGDLTFTVGKGTFEKISSSSAKLNVNDFYTRDLVTSYHGTTNLYEKGILDRGLISGSESGISQRFSGFKLGEVYTTPTKEWASGWANMAVYGKGTKVGEPTIFEVTMPRNTFETSLIRRGIEKGGSEEFVFKSIDSSYIFKQGKSPSSMLNYESFNKEFQSQLSKNFKLIPTTKESFTTDPFFAVSKRIKENLFVTRSGKISDITPVKYFELDKNTLKQVNDIKISANIKDLTVTKIVPKDYFVQDFVIESRSSGGSGQLALKQFKSSRLSNDLVNVNIMKESFNPKDLGSGLKSIQTSKSSFGAISGFNNVKLSSGLKLKQENRLKKDTYMPSLNLQGLSSSNKLGLGSLSVPSVQNSFKFSQNLLNPQATGLSQPQATKQDFKFEQNFFNNNNFSLPRGSSSGNGFDFGGFPPLLPSFSLGANYLVSPRKRRSKRKKQKIRPSFTAEVFNLKGTLPKQSSLGVNPFSLRAIPKSFKNPLKINF